MNNHRIIIQKYGGSSLRDAAQREGVSRKIIATKTSGYSPVVVLSAMGRKGDRYATDTLIELMKKECPEAGQRDLDLIMSCGELYSCIIMAALLRAQGVTATPLTGFQAGIITDDNFGSARICSIGTERILKLLEEGSVPIIAGFQGISGENEITTLGRGGSDTTATALGAALGAESVEIYTDVDGVMTIDPRIYPDAKIIRELTYQEMGEMANEGAKVLHSRCVDLSREFGTDLWVKGTFSEDRGSHISAGEKKKKKIVTGLIHRTGLSEFICDISGSNRQAETGRILFETLAEDGISLDLINLTSGTLYFTVTESESEQVKSRLRGLSIPHRTISGVAKISCIGQGMKGTPGVMAAIYDALCSAGINVLRSVDSYINISCLIEGKDLTPAIAALHEKLALDGEE